MDEEEAHEPIWHHIADLRKTVLRILGIIAVAFIACFAYYDSVLSFLQSPLQNNTILVLLGPLEGMLAAIKVSFWIATVGTSPAWLLVLLQFIFPGLKSKEKRMAIAFVLTSIVFVSLGLLFAFYITIPLANQYLLAFNETIGQNLWSLERYLDYTVFLLLANGFAFQLGALGVFAVRLGYLSAEMLISKRRHAIVAAFVLAALLTPPDVLTQLLLAIPLMGLYEGLILYARMLKRYGYGFGART